ncbi:NAD(P)H-dependent glycerol-3-phosphate dehydrogenase [Fructilactobacillus fructivorans]|uniref:Glycerol-3-phosphate dehydrogenase [NAD(P)+] n=1 Tax=Fructilactobacillus fructivorans TaxID=1614 RepID=A0A0C1Q1H7_9LACO|nr:NAD(P)H-dependent glycerol-3-phosphate dehydrogenase [Fructilactobacillus fructivorans]KID41673.1 Glycerol-3-phosphate dehydrogenase [NAD(P)+] [Fructilactobacillus fructivorans]MCT0151324.1 NAD(P)H-dependent glycerol-3-phosphate dehydrogenase [Fructilactobacillus fructivorans]MCT2867599.1 NAD(P)H-dependent glycerol-3-phosphate dehydrogenase [Fructilactobacillus fructivorans]MCT2868883.1 NAD(P)H-dependent glycerol-3-phosphate dehydrogenase [Fructilactobacillus fructivorans]MCT2873947.1 NAD(P
MTEKIAVLGAGSWGSMLADILVENGHEVRVWSKSKEQVDELNTKHTNSHYIKDFTFPTKMKAYADMSEALDGVDDILFIVPSQATRSVARQANEVLNQMNIKPYIIHGSKGIEKGSYDRMSQVLQEEIDEKNRKSISVISGPSQAEDVARRDITLVTAASDDMPSAEHFQKLFMNDYFRVYTNNDIIGVEIGGALKNIIALGAGALVGLGYGDNAKAALMTRGIAEISRLGVSFGADPLTFSGLSGLGDVIVTATSSDSRNWRAGYQLGQGKKLDDVVKDMGMVIEGIATNQAAYELSKQRGVEMPITSAIHAVINDEETVSDAISNLMAREGRSEQV